MTAASTALSSSEAIARKPKPSRIAKAVRRTRTMVPIAALGGVIRPIWFSARRSSPNTVVAPTSSVMMPTAAATGPAGSCQALAIAVSTACAATGPTSPAISPTT